MSIGSRIKHLRGSLSGAAFGALIGVTAQSVSQWESGDTNPSRQNLTKIADKFGVSLEWLINGVGAGPPPVIDIEHHCAATEGILIGEGVPESRAQQLVQALREALASDLSDTSDPLRLRREYAAFLAKQSRKQ